MGYVWKVLARNFPTVVTQIFVNFWTIIKNVIFKEKLFGQSLEKWANFYFIIMSHWFGLRLIHTRCAWCMRLQWKVVWCEKLENILIFASQQSAAAVCIKHTSCVWSFILNLWWTFLRENLNSSHFCSIPSFTFRRRNLLNMGTKNKHLSQFLEIDFFAPGVTNFSSIEPFFK